MRLTLLLLSSLIATAGASAEEVEHPMYLSWAKYPVGTVVTVKSTTIQRGRVVKTTYVNKLTDVTPDKLTIHQDIYADTSGKEEKQGDHQLTYRRMFPLIGGMKKEDIGKPEGTLARGEETIKTAGREFKTQWFDTHSQTEAGQATTRLWMSDEAPGKLVKSETKVPKGDKVTTLILFEIKKP